MNWWYRLVTAIRGRFFHRNPRRLIRIIPPASTHQEEAGRAAPPFPSNHDPMADALRRIAAMSDRAEERRAFRQVGRDGTVDEKVEEWVREGNEYIARTHHTKIVTCSGEIVAADKLQGVCWCGGYDDVISRCQACGRPLCRLHQRKFSSNTGELTLCDQHYREAMDTFNTWHALDAQRQARRAS